MSIVVVTEELCSASNFLRTYSHGFPFARTACPSEDTGLFINATVDDLDIIHELVGRRGSHRGAIHSNTRIQLDDMIPDKFCKIVPSVSHRAPKSVKKIYTVSPSGVVPAGDISESEPVIGFVIPNVCTDHDRAAFLQALNFLPSVPNFILPELHSPTPGVEPTSPMIKVEIGFTVTEATSLIPRSLLHFVPLRSRKVQRFEKLLHFPCLRLHHLVPLHRLLASLSEYNYNCYAFLDNGQ
ncbi:hypothetical protein EV401DRAFT_1969631 [Pisolithus croceorrhizus]|nr:hypothetical protein EV401DRAFT_1969631 [Pisolithus croceorrhizus]